MPVSGRCLPDDLVVAGLAESDVCRHDRAVHANAAGLVVTAVGIGHLDGEAPRRRIEREQLFAEGQHDAVEVLGDDLTSGRTRHFEGIVCQRRSSGTDPREDQASQ